MYSNGQVICDLTTFKAYVIDDVWGSENYPELHTHFIEVGTGKIYTGNHWETKQQRLKKANRLLEEHKIAPSLARGITGSLLKYGKLI